MVHKAEKHKLNWKPGDLDYLQEHYEDLTIKVKTIADRIGRSENAIYKMAKELGLKRPRSGKRSCNRRLTPWRVDDLDWKIYYYRVHEDLSPREIADRFNELYEDIRFNKTKIQNRMYSRGLHLHPPAGDPPVWYENIK
jgi:hypothetical protein